MKMKTISIVLGVILILAFASMFIIYNPQEETAYYYSGDHGIIEIETVEHNWFSKFFSQIQQSVTFAQQQVDLGDSVTLVDEYTIPIFGVLGPNEYINYHSVFIENLNSQSVSNGYFADFYNYETGVGASVISTYSWTPLEAGEYSATTNYFIIKCTQAPIPALNLPAQGCMTLINGCTFEDDCAIEDPSTNSVIVIDNSIIIPIECNKIIGFTEDKEDSNIANGIVYSKVFNNVNVNTCEYIPVRTVYTVVCEDGFGIDNTEDPTAEGKNHKCNQIEVSIDNQCTSNMDCTIPEKCSPVTSGCAVPNCDGTSITRTCKDGSIITIKECINNFQNDPVNPKTCLEDSNAGGSGSENDNGNTNDNTSLGDGIDYILLSLLAGVGLIIMLGVIIVRTQNK